MVLAWLLPVVAIVQVGAAIRLESRGIVSPTLCTDVASHGTGAMIQK
jgi:hypothetical protein